MTEKFHLNKFPRGFGEILKKKRGEKRVKKTDIPGRRLDQDPGKSWARGLELRGGEINLKRGNKITKSHTNRYAAPRSTRKKEESV